MTFALSSPDCRLSKSTLADLDVQSATRHERVVFDLSSCGRERFGRRYAAKAVKFWPARSRPQMALSSRRRREDPLWTYNKYDHYGLNVLVGRALTRLPVIGQGRRVFVGDGDRPRSSGCPGTASPTTEREWAYS